MVDTWRNRCTGSNENRIRKGEKKRWKWRNKRRKSRRMELRRGVEGKRKG